MRLLYPTITNAETRPDRAALVSGGAVWTHRDLEDASSRAARALASRGIAAGDRVALLGANGFDACAFIHAVGRLGAVLVPLHGRLASAEIRERARRATPALVAYTREFSAHVRALADAFACVPLGDLAAASAGASAPEPAGVAGGEPSSGVAGGEPSEPGSPAATHTIDPSAPHTILFTSGTSGRAKGIVLTFANHLESARASAAPLGVTAEDRWILCLTTAHVGGLAILLRAAILGFTVVVQDRFDPAAVWRSLRDDRATIVSLVPEMLARVLSHEPSSRAPETLRTVLLGGGPASRALLRAARERGFRVSTTYGLTETASQVTTLPWNEAAAEGDDCGPPIPGTEVRIVREDGADAEADEEGEILVRGPTVMRAYLDDPGETRAAFDDGWLRTGDIGARAENGHLIVHARRSDLFVSGGENVSPAEIESAIEAHPDVTGAIVVGVPDKRWGRAPAALVSVCEGARIREDDLVAFLSERLARFKIPRPIVMIERLPLTPSGKKDRAVAAEIASRARAARSNESPE